MLKIVPYPHPALRYPSKPITQFNGELKEIVREMFGLMYEARGIGLAANQVALPYQLFVLNITGDKESPEDELVFINPEIVKRTSTARDEEGCLSFPELYGKVFRAKRVRVRALDLEGNPFEVEADDLMARAIQHETDHVRGRLFIDLLSPLDKLAIGKKVQGFEKAFREAQERGEYAGDDELRRQLDDLASRSPV